ncbi:MAG: NAD(P)H-dependent glycerol-3-phosphate dehydrogenase [Pseudomonadota bacterium]
MGAGSTSPHSHFPGGFVGYRTVVIGGGSFGTAIANILADNGHLVRLCLRNPKAVAEIRETGINSQYLSGFRLNPALIPTTDLAGSVGDADLVFLAIPSRAFRDVLRDMKPHLHDGAILVSCTKGIWADGFLLMSQLMRQETGSHRIGVLSGPNLAKEIAGRMLSGSLIASDNADVRECVQQALSCSYFRVYANQDMFGVELAGALKNIYAIATGMADALGLGQNTKAMLITRSLAEMSRFAERMGGNPLTFLGLAGVGDLVVTCSSPLSRNYQVGFKLGQGVSARDTEKSLGQTAEGINTLELVKHKADELGVYMPLVTGLYDILFENQPLPTIIKRLMSGDQNSDFEFTTGRHVD